MDGEGFRIFFCGIAGDGMGGLAKDARNKGLPAVFLRYVNFGVGFMDY